MIIRTWVFFKRFDFKLLESFNYLWSAFIGLGSVIMVMLV